MLRMSMLTGALLALVLAGGCVGHASVGTSAYVSTPDMVYVSPGVYVVADQSDPIFYNDGYYWLYRDGYWMRSGVHHGSWVRVRSVPYAVRAISRPRAYVHYRARGRVYNDHRGRRYYRDDRSYRQQRGYRSAPDRRYRNAPDRRYRKAPPQRAKRAPVRDHRGERKHERRRRD